MSSPVRARTSGSRPRARRSSQIAAVRRHCQTTASLIGAPVARSQTIVVSRWFVMPIAAMSSAPSRRPRPAPLRGVELRRPDRLRIVRHPAGLRVDLRELERRLRDGRAAVVEEDRARAGGALVERQDVLRHALSVLEARRTSGLARRPGDSSPSSQRRRIAPAPASCGRAARRDDLRSAAAMQLVLQDREQCGAIRAGEQHRDVAVQLVADLRRRSSARATSYDASISRSHDRLRERVRATRPCSLQRALYVRLHERSTITGGASAGARTRPRSAPDRVAR